MMAPRWCRSHQHASDSDRREPESERAAAGGRGTTQRKEFRVRWGLLPQGDQAREGGGEARRRVRHMSQSRILRGYVSSLSLGAASSTTAPPGTITCTSSSSTGAPPASTSVGSAKKPRVAASPGCGVARCFFIKSMKMSSSRPAAGVDREAGVVGALASLPKMKPAVPLIMAMATIRPAPMTIQSQVRLLRSLRPPRLRSLWPPGAAGVVVGAGVALWGAAVGAGTGAAVGFPAIGVGAGVGAGDGAGDGRGVGASV